MGKLKSFYWQDIVEDQDGHRDAWDIHIEMALSYLDGCGFTREELIAKYSEAELVQFHEDGLWPEVAE